MAVVEEEDGEDTMYDNIWSPNKAGKRSLESRNSRKANEAWCLAASGLSWMRHPRRPQLAVVRPDWDTRSSDAYGPLGHSSRRMGYGGQSRHGHTDVDAVRL
jgi:hypothetical protein